jgi:serine protease inhibitor
MWRKTCLLLWLILAAQLSGGVVAQEDSAFEMVSGNSAFALDLYAELRNADGNFLFSPYSVSQALAMTYAGAGGETDTQMAEKLSFTVEQPALHEAFAALNADLVARGTAGADPEHGQVARALHIANALWGEQTYPFSEAYNAQLEQSYGTGLHQSDFINAPEETREEINAWVAEQTEDRIQDIVPEGNITPDTRLVLANAIYFYGGWEDTFEPEATEDGDFFLLDGSTVTVPFMFQREHLSYAQGNGFQVIEFPYAESDFAFTVILPEDGDFATVEDGLDSDTLNAALAELASTELLVYLPRFEFEYSASLAPSLQSLGMADAFDPASADFSGMVEGTPPEPLYIGDVLHKAFISVDENGTEAAAATVVIGVAGAAPPETEPIEVRIDRPFIFAIRDTQTGTLLFIGRVMNPDA